MLKDRRMLEDYLTEKFNTIAVDNTLCRQIYDYANEKYDIPKVLMSDIITRRIGLSELSEFVLFITLDALYNNVKNGKVSLNVYYTEQEIKFYSESKYIVDKIKFPLVFKMIQITDDQWIGKITVDTLMKLRKAQIINYNINTQRTMQKIVRGDKETYKISLNKKAVNEIKEAYEKDEFIPNTLTLNIPLETESNFYYDENNSQLVIKSLERFDITDGYHRYIGACQARDINPKFNYPMEIRIVNWHEDKAKQFTFQEDQKTKMTKIESNAMNMNNAANITVTRLNENIRCNFKGLINRNEGIISFAELAQLVDYFYFKGTGKKQHNTIMLNALKELTENFNMLSEYDTSYLEKRINYKSLLAIMFCFNYYKDKDKIEMCESINKLVKAINNSDDKRFSIKTPKNNIMKAVENLLLEVI